MKFLQASITNIGNGDFIKGAEIIIALSERLEHVRKKHNWDKTTLADAVRAMDDESKEVIKALHEEPLENIYYELYDVMAVSTRILAGEYEQ